MTQSNSIDSLVYELIDKVSSEPDKSLHLTRQESAEGSWTNGDNISEKEPNTCRICYDSDHKHVVVFPCKCKGTMGAVHLSCLEHWLEESNRNSCELCGHEFQVERMPRYRAIKSMLVWSCLSEHQHQLYVRSLRIDLLRCVVVTPITIGCSYVCIVAADFYSMTNYDNFPPAKWTTYSLLAMMTLLIFSYFVWMYMAVQYHHRVWFYWWQKSSVVKVILPSNIKSGIKNSI